jgi:hypothetical protein
MLRQTNPGVQQPKREKEKGKKPANTVSYATPEKERKNTEQVLTRRKRQEKRKEKTLVDISQDRL